MATHVVVLEMEIAITQEKPRIWEALVIKMMSRNDVGEIVAEAKSQDHD